MKKTLLLVFAMASLCTAMAQPVATATWNQSIAGVADVQDVYRTAPVAITADGDVYATGRFNQMIATENLFLEPVAQSAYLIKYDKNGGELWGVSLAGSATITAVATDANENVYVAGVMADQVTFNTTAGEAQTLAGAKDEWGDYVSAQTTSFIAKYNAEGALQTVKAYVPARHPDVNGMKDDIMGPYYWPIEDGSFKINNLMVEGDKVYASASYCGQTQVDNLTFTGSLVNIAFIMIDNLSSAAIFSLSADNLEGATLVADFNSNEALTYDLSYKVNSIDFTVSEGVVYAGAIAMGNIKMITPAGTENFEFAMDGMGTTEYGHIIAAINGNETVFKTFAAPANTETSKESIEDMQVYGNALFIAGTFNDVLAYNNNKTSTNKMDLYVAALNKETLECGSTWVSGYDEQETNKNEELFTSMIVADGDIYLNGYTRNMSTKVINNNLSFIIDETGVNGGESDILVTGADKNATSLVFAEVKNGENTVSYFDNMLTAIESVANASDLNIRYAQGELLFSTTADVEIWSMQGYMVECTNGVNNVNVNHLPKGLYIARVTTANSNAVYKFIKK